MSPYDKCAFCGGEMATGGCVNHACSSKVTAQLLWVNPNHHADVREQVEQLRCALTAAQAEAEEAGNRWHSACDVGRRLESRLIAAQAEAANLRRELEQRKDANVTAFNLRSANESLHEALVAAESRACTPAERAVLWAVALDVGVDGLDYDEWSEKVWIAREEMMLARRATREQPTGEEKL